jgi:hypothetical protein
MPNEAGLGGTNFREVPRPLAIMATRSTKVGRIRNRPLLQTQDASQEGYGAVAYLRIENKQDEVKCSFVMGKSRLAPIKSVTIPLMELSAAVTAVKLNKMCQVELSLPVEEKLFWTDSICVLKYLENEAKMSVFKPSLRTASA